ncbi:MAG: electron transfer flavoprotein subunit alpha/FixB family protein [Bacteroidales bacterium]|nr:electron transfer flavoprotein subunit alpha/FixB family protein [Bacteroidales bacterium]
MSVLVYTENWDGKFKKLSLELVSYASSLAKMVGGSVTALSIGKVEQDELSALGAYGATNVLSVDDAPGGLDNQLYTSIITAAMEMTGSKVLVLAHNNTGKAIAPRLSVRLKAGLATGVTALPESVDPLVVPKKVFSGKAFAKVKILTDSAILTLAQNSFELTETGGSASIEAFDPGVDVAGVRTSIRDVQKQEGKLLLSDAEVVISGGRGMKSTDNWGPIEELAEVLGGATACSRPVSDEGWRPHEEHTGQTGKIIAPNLYMAFGISGAIQHLAGVSSSKCIVAVNTDKDAPIFEAADYGIVGDALKVLPELVTEIKAAKAQ